MSDDFNDFKYADLLVDEVFKLVFYVLQNG